MYLCTFVIRSLWAYRVNEN